MAQDVGRHVGRASHVGWWHEEESEGPSYDRAVPPVPLLSIYLYFFFGRGTSLALHCGAQALCCNAQAFSSCGLKASLVEHRL